jgi:hypothetical protein
VVIHRGQEGRSVCLSVCEEVHSLKEGRRVRIEVKIDEVINDCVSM